MVKLTIKENAYQIDFNKVDEGYLYGECICYAENVNKAKSELLSEVEDCKNYLGDDITYLNIPVIRCKSSDKVEFKGEVIKRYEVERKIRIEELNKKLDSYLTDSSITHCYIMKRGTYYGWNYSGYVSYKTFAGVYTKEDAVKECKNLEELTCVPINNTEHNELILNQVARIKKGLIAN